MLSFKKFSGLRPGPRWGLNATQTPTCKAPPFTAGYAPVGYERNDNISKVLKENLNTK